MTTVNSLIRNAERVFKCTLCDVVMMTGDGALLHEDIAHEGRTTMRPVRWCSQHQRFHGLDAEGLTLDDLANG